MGGVLVPEPRTSQDYRFRETHSEKTRQRLSKAKKMTQEIANCAVNFLPSSTPVSLSDSVSLSFFLPPLTEPLQATHSQAKRAILGAQSQAAFDKHL